MLKRLGLVIAMLSMTLVVASPAFAQSSLGDSIESFTDSLIERTFSEAFGSPSQSQYDQTGNTGGNGGGGVDGGGAVLPAGASQDLCENIVQNESIPASIRFEIAEDFGLDCGPSGGSGDSFFSSLFGGSGIFSFFGSFFNLFGF